MADTLYETAARWYDKEMALPLRNVLVGRSLFMKRVIMPPGSYNADYKSLTDIGDAEISGEGVPLDTAQVDTVKLTTNNLKACTVYRAYRIARPTWNAMKKAGYALDTDVMMSAMYKVADKEDNLLLNGWTADGTNYDIEGLYQAADNNYSTTKDFGTAGNAMLAVSGGWALLIADNVVGFNMNLTLNPTQYEELVASVLGSGAGQPEMPLVLNQLNPYPNMPKGQIFVSNNITAATGLMSPVDPTGSLIDLVIGQDTRNIIATEKFPGVSDIEAAVYCVIVPRVKQLNSCCRLSSI